MSYEVIARRWRPQDFRGLVGQEHVRKTLLNALRHDRLHHALLLTGPRGTGKTSTARILAKALRCPNAVDFNPCNVCAECLDIASGRSLNVIEIDGASNNGVDAIRELRETVGYLPPSGKYKMYIIDEVHMLSTSAFNALLKTLEEPPGHVYFVMATTEAQKIPSTILSRVQRFDFRRIPTRTIAAHLRLICEGDKIDFEPEALWVIARQGDGSMRDAQSLLDQVINFVDGPLKGQTVVETLGLTDRSLMNEALAAVLNGQVKLVVHCLARLHRTGGEPKLFLLDFIEQIRNALLIKMATGHDAESSLSELVDLPDSERESLAALATPLAAEDLHLYFDMGLKGAQDLTRASDPLLVLEMVLLRMASAGRLFAAPRENSTAPPENFTTPPGGSKAPRASSGGPVPGAQSITRETAVRGASAPKISPPAVKSGPSIQAASAAAPNRFSELVEKVKEVNGLVGAQLENCFIVRQGGTSVELGLSARHKFLFDKMNTPEFKKKVVNYLNTYWGPGHDVQFTLAEAGVDVTSPKALNEKLRRDEAQIVRDAVDKHPLVQSARSTFKTEIKSIKEIKE